MVRRGGFRSDIAGGIIGAVLGSVLVLGGLYWFLSTSNPGVTPVAARFGLAEDSDQYTAEAFAAYPQAFSVDGGRTVDRSSNIRLWEAVAKVHGSLPTNIAQQIGDCVSWGLRNSVIYSAATKGKKVVPSSMYFYGLARVTIGRNRPGCNTDGAVSSWAKDGFVTRGWIYETEAPAYKGSTAKDWGCKGPPRDMLAIGATRGGDAYPIRSVDELIDALGNGFASTYAGKFGTKTIREIDGRQVATWNDTWPHQMCFVGYDGSLGIGHEYFCVLNSWGPNAHPAPLNGEPPGSFWVTRATAERMIDQGECWAIADVRGFTVDPDEIDWSVFDVTARDNVVPSKPVPRKEEDHVSFAIAL